MSKNKLILAAIIALPLLLVVTFIMLERFGPPHVFQLELSGKPGLEVVGVVEEYGVKRDVALTLPAKLTLEGQHIFFEFAPKTGAFDEPLAVSVDVDAAFAAKVTSSPGIRGRVHRPRLFAGIRSSHAIGSMPREDVERLRRGK